MKRRWPLGLLLGLLALVGGGGLMLWLSQHLEPRNEEIHTGYGEAIRRNPFYLAERLLARLGVSVRGVRRLADLPDPLDAVDTLLVAIPTYALSAAEGRRLLDWVEGGGHLIIGVPHAFEPGRGLDPILDPLQIRGHRAGSPTTEPVSIQLDESMPPLQVRFQSDLQLDDAPWQHDRWGRGWITLLNDIGVFDNARLAEHDHADFLWALIRRQDRGGQVWLQYRMLAPSLAQLLWRHAWMPLLGLALTLLATLWRHGRRLGPVWVPRSGQQRRLAEHLRASSRFLWRHGAGPLLLQAARQYALRRGQRRRPGAPPDSAVLLDSDQPLSERALIRTLQTLQRLNRHPPS